MNKKFSTLVAVILAAGAWTTLDAKVVVVESETPAAGTYIVGSSLSSDVPVVLTVGAKVNANTETKITKNEVDVTTGADGINFEGVDAASKWQLVVAKTDVQTEAKLKVTIGETAYYLCYADGTFSLSADESDANLLIVKDASEGLTVVKVGNEIDGKLLSLNTGELTLADENPLTVIGSSEVTKGSLVAETDYVLADKALAEGTKYLTGAYETQEVTTPAYYPLTKETGNAALTDDSKAIWTVAEGGEASQFTLTYTDADGGAYVVVADAEGSIKAVSKGEGVTATAFKMVAGELVTVDASKEFDFSSTLGMINATTDNTDNAIEYAKWEKDETPAPETPADSYPGYGEAKVDEDGVVTVEENTTIDAPLAVSVEVGAAGSKKTIYLSVNGDGEVVETESPVLGAASAWGVESGVYYSIAAKRANPTNQKIYLVKAKVATASSKAASETYFLGPKFGEGIEAVKSTDVTTTINTTTPAASIVNSVSILNQSVARVSSVDKDEYVFVALNATAGGVTTVLGQDGKPVALGTVSESNLKKCLWKVTETQNKLGKYYYTFQNMDDATKFWSVDGGITEFYATGQYSDNTDLYLSNNGKEIGADFEVVAAGQTVEAISLYKSPLIGRTNTFLNALLGDGFKLTIKINKDSKKEVEYLDAFAGKLTAQGAKDAQQFEIMSGDKKNLVLNTAKLTNITGVNGVFELVDAKDKDKEGYLSEFQINYLFGGKSSDLVAELVVAPGTAKETKAYIVQTPDGNYLTTKKTLTGTETRPYILLGEDNVYAVKNLLGKFWNFSYAETKADAKDANEEYKLNGVLAVTYDDATSVKSNVADYVGAGTVLLTAPEAQWAVVDADLDANTVTLQNRENSSIQITGVQLRHIAGDKFIVTSKNTSASEKNFNDDLVVMNEVEKTTKYDGFMQTTANALRNQNYHLGQYHAIDGNNHAYFVENHAGSHQIGLTAEKEYADKWNLSFAMKQDKDGDYTEVDTVLVITSFATLKDGKIVKGNNKDAVKDTLAILPYAFQKDANSEFVAFNPESKKNFDFYVCDPKNKDNDQSEGRDAARFALKVKPNGAYNFVRIAPATETAATKLDVNKVYVGNSFDKGSLENMLTYAKDQNSLMVVEVADAPEYRKVKAAWGDTVRIYRQEYQTEELFEKADAKSVVDGNVLSFLNVNNSLKNTNPALFVDTAYVNRVDANGIENTRYQYLLAVGVDKENSYYCPYNTEHNTDAWRDKNGGPCADAKEHRAVKGRFLINLVDTAFAYKEDHLHNNPYINMVEADENLAKLSFVEGIHADDTLYITRKGGEVVKLAMDAPEFNVAKFAFRYVDNDAQSFKIQTQYKDYDADDMEDFEKSASDEGYLRWVNGTVVVTKGFTKGEVFNMEENYEGNPTANEAPEVSSVSVIATNGAVIIKGAEGKKVSISNVLGQTIANTVVTSSEATISAPAGVVVVAVEGEAAVKAIVK